MLTLALIFSIVSFALSITTIVLRFMAQKETRAERIARCRATIAGVRAAEVTLDGVESEHAALILAGMRSHAVHAKHELRLLGIEA